MKRILLLLMLGFLSLTSCETLPHFDVAINSFSRQNAVALKTFIIIPGNKNTNANDLEFMEYVSYVERALATQGYIKEENGEKADMLIFLAYGIGKPEEHNYTYSFPVFGQTGVASKQTYGNLYTFGNMGLYSEQTTYTPQYGITGYGTGQGSFTTYSRYIYITAYDLIAYRENKSENIMWDTRIASVGSSGDLRRVFPVMIAASLDDIGKNTKGIKEVSLEENDDKVLIIKDPNSHIINNSGRIGVRINITEIQEIYPDTPASRAGILPGDKIIEINGKENLSGFDLINELHGEPGSNVHIKIKRMGIEKPIDFDLVRQRM
jgi:hypothetical protein